MGLIAFVLVIVGLVWWARHSQIARFLNLGSGKKGSKYDELWKLSALKDRGLITDEEFEKEKSKLLQQDER